MVVHTCNSSTQEAGGSRFQDQSGLHNKTASKNSIVYLNCIPFSFVSYTSIKLGAKDEEGEGKMKGPFLLRTENLGKPGAQLQNHISAVITRLAGRRP
jgi:hypothetical protein